MVVDEIRSQIMQSLYTYDFSSAFPGGYTGTKAVTIVHGWPYELLDNMLSEADGQMTMPIVSVLDADVIDTYRSLGNVSTIGAPVGMTRRATRVEANYLIGCWADRRLGGADTAEKLGGLVVGWAFLNQVSLAAYRQLRTSTSHAAFKDRQQLWRYDVILTGHALLTYDS
jgi:hypothetical protein